jgi:hypothetical protein
MGHWQAPTSKRKFYKHKERRKESYHVCIEMFKLRGKWYVNSKWGLENIQGIEFDNEYKLARELYSKIEKYEKEYSAQVDKRVKFMRIFTRLTYRRITKGMLRN